MNPAKNKIKAKDAAAMLSWQERWELRVEFESDRQSSPLSWKKWLNNTHLDITAKGARATLLEGAILWAPSKKGHDYWQKKFDKYLNIHLNELRTDELSHPNNF